MSQPTTLAQMQTSAVAAPKNDVPMSLLTGSGFDQLQRVAKALCASTLVPAQYRAFTEVKTYGKVTGHNPNPAGLPNCVVALNMAMRMGADPLMVMQNLYVIEGRPSWSSQFIIAAINSCGRFSPLRFEISEPDKEETVEFKAVVWKNDKKTEEKRSTKVQHRTCRAWVIEKETGERLDGPTVSMQMAIDEGWLTKNGSKWQTMPEIMLRYRAASLFGRLYAPELLMGLQTQEEAQDFIDATPDGAGNYAVDVNDLRNKEPEAPAIIDDDAETVDTETGEIVTDSAENASETAESATDQAEDASETAETIQAADTDGLNFE
ncbi:recombinase RecT [Pseudomonas helleri]|uniref:recombinase RecT n=1 Tax=Pseudomonas helleri TaxID=1608996 RepID=UPI003FD39CE3